MHAPPPPSLPPKPGSHDTSRIGTPVTSNSPRPGTGSGINSEGPGGAHGSLAHQQAGLEFARPEPVPDPGDQWLPTVLQDKSYDTTGEAQFILRLPLLIKLFKEPWLRILNYRRD
ncbi:hypothetical protein CcaCcLH18_06353 [Colletotrichum camelliae]|nr:hypothetical protein CcaCcLH18_06353 [Colletotrichum camelliae]